MDRGVNSLQFLGALEIIGNHKDVGIDGAQQCERCVQHQGRISGALGILHCVGDGDGAYGCSKTATHACDAEGGEEKQRQEAGASVLPLVEHLGIERGSGVALPKEHHQECKQHYQIPVAQEFGADDAAKVPFARELIEDRRGGAPHGVSEIDGVGQIDGKRQSVYNHKYPLADAVISGCLLEMQGEQHQHHIERIGIKDGRGVEHQAPAPHVEGVVEII